MSMPTTMMAIRILESFSNLGAKLSASLGFNSLKRIPIITGMTETTNTPKLIFNVEKLNGSSVIKILLEIDKTSGAEITHTNVLIPVKLMDSGRLPLHSWLTTLDKAPPGHADISMMPTQISPGKLNKIHINKPIIGSAVIWQIKPTRIDFGILNRLEKSALVKVRPIPNMMATISIGITIFENMYFSLA